MTKVNLDLSEIEKELRGHIYEGVNKQLEKFNFEKYIDKYFKEKFEGKMQKLVNDNVYKYMEEAEIAVPDGFREKKMTLNTFMIQIIREVVTQRMIEEIDKYKFHFEIRPKNVE